MRSLVLLNVDMKPIRFKAGTRQPVSEGAFRIVNDTKKPLAVHGFEIREDEVLVERERLDPWVYLAPGDVFELTDGKGFP
jgi:hypothetical protein